MRERDREQHASKIQTRDVAVDGAGAIPVALILTFIKICLLWFPHLYGKAILTHRSSLLRSIFNVYTHRRLFKLSGFFYDVEKYLNKLWQTNRSGITCSL